MAGRTNIYAMKPSDKAFYDSHGIPTEPQHNGQKPDQGRIVIEPMHENEGYAVLSCGNTSVQLSYTVLHHLQISAGSMHRIAGDVRRALDSIMCEAGLGRTGDYEVLLDEDDEP